MIDDRIRLEETRNKGGGEKGKKRQAQPTLAKAEAEKIVKER